MHRTTKLTVQEVFSFLEGEGYFLLSDYINDRTKVSVRCPVGHECLIHFSQFKRGKRCFECFGKRRLTLEHVRSEIEKAGYRLLSSTYSCARIPLQLVCPYGHEWTVCWNSFQQGNRCISCKSLDIDDANALIEPHGYTLVSTSIKGAQDHLWCICPKGHLWEFIYNSFQQGVRCGHCLSARHESRLEIEVRQFVQRILPDAAKATRMLRTQSFELDAYSPSTKKAVEVDGERWHHSEWAKRKGHWDRDRRKDAECTQAGIQLFRVRESEWPAIQPKLAEFLRAPHVPLA